MSLSAIWNAFVAFLVWLSADPQAVDLEAPSPPAPAPTACDCGSTCVRGVWKPDGRIEQRCSCKCKRCEAERAKGKPAVCTTGTCR
jgi:hypothetical protein